jgi:hypothetical protein
MNAAEKNSRVPIMLSAFVYPGLGQFVQRRWAAGLIYLLSFTVFFVIFGRNVLVPLFQTLQAVLDFAAGEGNGKMVSASPLGILVPFGLSTLIFFASLMDVIRASRRRPLRPPPLPTA